MSNDEKPRELWDVKDSVQKSLTELGEDPEKEQLKRQVLFMVKSFEYVYAIAESERKTLIAALCEAQSNASNIYSRLHESKWGRLKLFIKKILVGKGWYEASSQELQLIHQQNHGVPK